MKLFLYFNSLFFTLGYLDKNNNIEVNKKENPTTLKSLNIFSIKSLSKNPTKAIGMVAIIILNNKLIYSFSFLKTPITNFLISSLKTIKTTSKLPKCNIKSNTTGCSILNKFCSKTKCPEELIGSHSVIPCTIPNIIASIILINIQPLLQKHQQMDISPQ